MVTKLHSLLNAESVLPLSVLDGEIPALQIIFDRQQLGQYLSRVLPSEWGDISDIQFQVLQRHRGRRWTISIALQTATGKHDLIGKVYAKDRADVYRAMKQISQAGFAPEAEFSIPEPVAYIPQLNLLLIEKVPGSLATDDFVTGDEDLRAQVAERCALWLAHFHNSAPPLGTVYKLTTDRMQGWVHRLTSPFRDLEDKAQLLSEQLEQAASVLSEVDTCACHGGFWHEQIILNDERVVTVDWDNHCTADPARDVAKFIVELEQLALRSHGSLDALSSTIEIFYNTYTSRSKFTIAKSLPAYKAAVCLKRAKHHLRRNGGGPEQADAMLEEGLQALAQRV